MIVLVKDSFDLDDIALYEKNDSDTPTGYQVLGVYFPEDATHEDIEKKVNEILADQKLRGLIEVRRIVAHEMWNAEEIRKDGINPSQREFVLDMEFEKLLHEADKK